MEKPTRTSDTQPIFPNRSDREIWRASAAIRQFHGPSVKNLAGFSGTASDRGIWQTFPAIRQFHGSSVKNMMGFSEAVHQLHGSLEILTGFASRPSKFRGLSQILMGFSKNHHTLKISRVFPEPFVDFTDRRKFWWAFSQPCADFANYPSKIWWAFPELQVNFNDCRKFWAFVGAIVVNCGGLFREHSPNLRTVVNFGGLLQPFDGLLSLGLGI